MSLKKQDSESIKEKTRKWIECRGERHLWRVQSRQHRDGTLESRGESGRVERFSQANRCVLLSSYESWYVCAVFVLWSHFSSIISFKCTQFMRSLFFCTSELICHYCSLMLKIMWFTIIGSSYYPMFIFKVWAAVKWKVEINPSIEDNPICASGNPFDFLRRIKLCRYVNNQLQSPYSPFLLKIAPTSSVTYFSHSHTSLHGRHQILQCVGGQAKVGL